MTCSDDGTFDVSETTPHWQIHKTGYKMWMKLQHPGSNVLRKMYRGSDGSQDNDTRVVIRDAAGKALDFGQLKKDTPYFIQSFVNPAAWLGCDTPKNNSNVVLKSVPKIHAKQWEFTGGMDNQIKLSGHSGYKIHSGNTTLGSKWYSKKSNTGSVTFNVWHPKNWGFESV